MGAVKLFQLKFSVRTFVRQYRCFSTQIESSRINVKDFEREARIKIKEELTGISSPEHWDTFIKKLLNREIKLIDMTVNDKNVDGVILRLCRELKLFDVGQSYFQYATKNNKKLNSVVLSQYLNLCTLNRPYALKNKSELLKIYRSITSCDSIESTVAERCISAICLFEEHWEDAFYLLQQVKLLSEPTPTSYNSIIEACFKFGKIERGFQLLEDLVTKSLSQPFPACYIAYIDHCQKLVDEKLFTLDHIEKLFNFLDNFYLNIPDVSVVDRLEKFIFSLSDEYYSWSLKETFIPRSGACINCRRSLEPVKLTPDEFNELSKRFVEKALVGSNVFLKSTPEEITRFKTFVNKSLNCNIVIDGLNVAYSIGSKSPVVMSKNLRSVASFFIRKGWKVAVLGRMHMKKWPDMDYLLKNCNVFFTTNLSQDDPLILYTALRGGENTYFLSRDLMRSHTFALEDPKTKVLFRKWLISHQYKLNFVDRDGKSHVQPPLPYRPTAQKLPLETDEICWHIPYYEEHHLFPTNKTNKKNHHPKWLCIRRVRREVS